MFPEIHTYISLRRSLIRFVISHETQRLSATHRVGALEGAPNGAQETPPSGPGVASRWRRRGDKDHPNHAEGREADSLVY